MNKRYIDFVPAKKGEASAAVRSVRVGGANGARSRVMRTNDVRPRAAMVTRTTVTKTTVTGVAAQSMPAQPVTRARVAPRRTAASAATAPVRVMPAERKLPADKTPVLGVIEDLNTHFVNTDVPKRPLSEKPNTVGSVSAAEVKAKRVKMRGGMKPVAKSTAKQVRKEPVESAMSAAATYKTPRTPFINQNKVVKRPLSGNIYRKQIVEAVKEEPKGPVTIIAKPEKDKHIGVIVTIIVTIILGAAAGTVAFLLLPK